MSFGFSRSGLNKIVALVWRGHRKILGGFLFLAISGTVLYAGFVSFTEEQIDAWIERPVPRGPLHYSVTIDSMDVDSRVSKARAQLLFEPLSLSHIEQQLQRDLGKLPDLLWNHEKILIYYGELVFRDQGEEFSILGLDAFFFPVPKLKNPPQEGLPPKFSPHVPEVAKVDLKPLGNPKLYPFDKYLLAGEVHCDVLATLDERKYALVSGEWISVRFHDPAFVLRFPRENELERWETVEARIGMAKKHIPKWANRFSFIAERPFFLRFLSVFLLLVAVASTYLVLSFENRKQLALNVTGYFVSLWTIRSVLSAWGPKGPNLIDFVTLGLYALLVALVVSKLIWKSGASSEQADN